MVKIVFAEIFLWPEKIVLVADATTSQGVLRQKTHPNNTASPLLLPQLTVAEFAAIVFFPDSKVVFCLTLFFIIFLS